VKAALLSENGFEIKEIEKPECKKNEVIIKTKYCGICEGDLHRYKMALENNELPEIVLLGHEGSGVVVEVGECVEDFKVGDRVTAMKEGAFAEYFAAASAELAKIEGEGDYSELNKDPLGEAVACCVHAGNRFNLKAGDSVALIGAGFMGLVSLELAQLQGAVETAAFDLLDWRLEKAKILGADEVYNPNKLSAADKEKLEEKFDLVIEATGVQAAVDMASDLVKKHGRIVLLGYHQSNNGIRQVDMKKWNYKAIDVINGHVRNLKEKRDAMELGYKLVDKNKIKLEEFVSEYKFKDIEEAFKDLKNRKKDIYKISLTFSG
jgi:threonine dehydrogenase-like Zn-dependent dehydrogenase